MTDNDIAKIINKHGGVYLGSKAGLVWFNDKSHSTKAIEIENFTEARVIEILKDTKVGAVIITKGGL